MHPEIGRMFHEHTYRHQFDQRTPFPEEIFRLAMKDSLIKTYIDAWRAGQFSWEAALIGIIVARQQQYETLFQSAVMSMNTGLRSTFLVTPYTSTPSTEAEHKAHGKEEALKYIEDNKLTILAQHGRTFIVTPGIDCIRWYNYIIVSVKHEQLDRLIKEGLTPLE